MPAAEIEWNEGWPHIEAAIHRVIAALEAETPRSSTVTVADYMNTYRLVYDMCLQHGPRDYAEALYDSYKRSIQGYVLSSVMDMMGKKVSECQLIKAIKVLPALMGKHGEFLLREFVRRWSNHTELVKWLSRFFAYLERFYIVRKKLPALTVTGQLIFLDAVYEKMGNQLTTAVLSMIHEEREGSLIDGVLLKKSLDIYGIMGVGNMKFYEQGFEAQVLSNTAAYYSLKARTWILACSFSDYMHKANECIRQEEERASRYFQICTKQRLLELVHHELFVVLARQLEEKKQTDAFVSEEVINQWLAQRCERLAL